MRWQSAEELPNAQPTENPATNSDANNSTGSSTNSASEDSGETPGRLTGDTSDTIELPRRDVERFVADFLAERGIIFGFDGTFRVVSEPVRADTPDKIAAVLDVEPIDYHDLLDQLCLANARTRSGFNKSLIASALRRAVKRRRHLRRKDVLQPLVQGDLTDEERERAHSEWSRLPTVFEMSASLCAAVFRHFIWQVKRKALRLEVAHHLMPVIFSLLQGTGKTRFVNLFLAPLEELAGHGVLLSDLADRRSGDIFAFPVVVIDDIECLPPSQIPILKSLLTGDLLRRRRLGTSVSNAIRQSTTPIGTANQPIGELIDDETGHRRFAVLPFRNGFVEKGGSADVWKAVNAINYLLLWRSVDPYSGAPILPHLSELIRHQSSHRPVDGFVIWLRGVGDSERFREIVTTAGVPAQALRELSTAQTGIPMTANRFAALMDRHLSDPLVPFADKIKRHDGHFYRLKDNATGAVTSVASAQS